jgi:DnaJ-class molecular chaperone
MDKTQAARLEHLGLTAQCSECGGAGYFQVGGYGPIENCDDCKGKGWVITPTGEALIALSHEHIYFSDKTRND